MDIGRLFLERLRNTMRLEEGAPLRGSLCHGARHTAPSRSRRRAPMPPSASDLSPSPGPARVVCHSLSVLNRTGAFEDHP